MPELSAEQVHPCETAEQLLDGLDPAKPHWGKNPQAWCFRGQSEDLPLTPTALRNDARRGPLSMMGGSVPGLDEQFGAHREFIILQDFLVMADRAGHAIPHDHPAIRGWRRLSTLVSGPETPYLAGPLVGWPPDELLGVLALAQHYGLPTRLLDWSYRPMVAAYFATQKVASNRAHAPPDAPEPSRNMVVWALNTRWMDLKMDPLVLTDVIAHHLGPLPSIALVEAPHATNPNLSAQAGVFTLDREARVGAEFNADLVRAIKKELDAWPGEGVWPAQIAMRGPIVFHKFTLPHAQGRRLLRLLGLHGVHAATVFPGHKSVVESMQEKLYWEA